MIGHLFTEGLGHDAQLHLVKLGYSILSQH